jgi:pyruvate carboxylase
VFFELNGQPRNVTVVDKSLESKVARRTKADPADPLQVAAPMPGSVVVVAVKVGDQVAPGQKLLSMEAMKMETTLYSDKAGKVAEILVGAGSQVETGDLVVRLSAG